ncbi:MAG: MBL fold metallo-hydrolase [Geodermatophilaceae bacterium]|nr:MBL fold metallo-hydrolase [Geodermatophilaceae bacterium]
MTLDGTNTWLLGAPDRLVVVDPGPEDGVHLETVASAGRIERILLTHRHPDHSEGAARLHELCGAPVDAADPRHRHGGGGDLTDGDLIGAGNLRITVLATPGHTSDSVSLLLDDGSTQAVLTGDTILGRGTTVVAHPDGVLADYLASLRRLAGVGDAIVLPGHGPELPSIVTAAEEYLAHRAERLAQVRAALQRLGPQTSARQIVEDVYADVDRSVWSAAELSVRAQLDYLERH